MKVAEESSTLPYNTEGILISHIYTVAMISSATRNRVEDFLFIFFPNCKCSNKKIGR